MVEQTPKDILDILLERRDKITRELNALENLIVVYRGLSNEASSESVSTEPGQLRFSLQRSPRAVQAAAIARSMEAARRIMLSERRPMKRGELVKRLQAEGLTLPGTDKSKVLGTNLWRSGKFRTIEGQGYWPKDVKLP